MLLFVYGSLRKYLHNHYILKDSRYIGKFVSKEKYYMLSNNDLYPYLLLDPEGCNIIGEIYEISETVLKNIDKLEDCPNLYMRNIGQFYNIREKTQVTEAYFYIIENKTIIDKIKNLNIIKDGDWYDYLAKKNIKIEN